MQKFTGLEYLKIDIANNYGYDKTNWDERIAWFDNFEDQLENLVKAAEEPALFYAGVQAYRKAQQGKPSGYPISLDATSSGIQLLACLTGDRKAAELCNVVNTGKREDAYTGLYHKMVEKIGEGAKIDRKSTKQAIMTAFYGSTAMPKNIFGEGALLTAFFETMQENAPGAWELNQSMLAIWDKTALVNEWVMPDNFHVKVKVMNTTSETVNFLNQPFQVDYVVNAPSENGRSLCANTTHSVDGMIVREMSRRCNYNEDHIANIKGWFTRGANGAKSSRTEADAMVLTLLDHYEASGFFSARILDYVSMDNLGHVIDRARYEMVNLLHSLPKKPFEVLSVHDCFRCLPNYGNDLRQQYNNLLAEVAQSEMLSFIVSQLMKRQIRVTKLDNTLYEDILVADYALS